MHYSVWYLISGWILLVMALSSSLLRRLPLTTAIIYLVVGVGLGPAVLGVLTFDFYKHGVVLEGITEAVVLVSLFTAGLKMRVEPSNQKWFLPIRLAIVSMVVTVGCIALVAVLVLGLPIGAAILLGAILAPTDPVLASDVQVSDPFDRDRLRFSLTGEAGLNDGSAYPLIMLGLALLGVRGDGGHGVLHWFAVEVVWAVPAGIACGVLFGASLGRAVLFLRQQYRESVGLDDFLTLGIIAVTYGISLQLHLCGFLAVFSAGVALRWVEMRASGDRSGDLVRESVVNGAPEELSIHVEKAPAYLAHAMLSFNEQLERIGEVAVVTLLGSILLSVPFQTEVIWFIPLLFFFIRPLSTKIGLAGSATNHLQRQLIGWFGIRGVGSVYYLTFAMNHGLPPSLGRQFVGITLATVATSIVLHGVSVTPIMDGYRRVRNRSVRNAPPKDVIA